VAKFPHANSPNFISTVIYNENWQLKNIFGHRRNSYQWITIFLHFQ